MFRKPIAVVASIVLSAGLATSSAYAVTPQTIAKVGGTCPKLAATATINKVAYICAKSSATKKLIWVKKKVVALSAECLGMKNAYLNIKTQYDTALAQLADAEAKINAVPGPDGDALRAKFAISKATILSLGPTVSNAQAQFNMFCK